tara:strand:+ start:94 stop:420 length:327 start_codon:yes stop_codon:yes gene_type:complete
VAHLQYLPINEFLFNTLSLLEAEEEVNLEQVAAVQGVIEVPFLEKQLAAVELLKVLYHLPLDRTLLRLVLAVLVKLRVMTKEPMDQIVCSGALHQLAEAEALDQQVLE